MYDINVIICYFPVLHLLIVLIIIVYIFSDNADSAFHSSGVGK